MKAHVRLSLARNPDGAVEALVAIITDVTSRKETEPALQKGVG
jgi:signal transduction histidine kinase